MSLSDRWIASLRPTLTGSYHARHPAPSPERAEEVEKARFGCGETLEALSAARRRTRGESEDHMKTEDLILVPRVEMEAMRHV